MPSDLMLWNTGLCDWSAHYLSCVKNSENAGGELSGVLFLDIKSAML